MKKIVTILTLIIGLTFALSTNSITFQGYLTDQNGAPVFGTKYMKFEIYPTASGGTKLIELPPRAVTVYNGNYATRLVFSKTQLHELLKQDEAWVQVYVGDNPSLSNSNIMQPRILLNSTPFALNGVPRGAIIMWSGSISDIPPGWALCDGSNGTPDLRDRFIVGAGRNYSIGNTGGYDRVTLNISEMPNHTHTVNDPGHNHYSSFRQIGGAGNGVDDLDDGSGYLHYTSTSYTGITLGYTGGGQPHENRPPYYALAFIMKL